MDASLVIDQQTVLVYASFLGFALFGSLMRTLFGLYRAYSTYPDFRPEKARMAVEMVASTCFGIFAALILQELKVFSFGLNIMALVAGLLGADLIGLITKKLGVTRSMQIVLSRQQMDNADLTDKQVRTMEYAKSHGSITNRVYQTINGTGPDMAKKDLHSLVKKGRLSKIGHTKDVRYVPLAQKNPVPNPVNIRPSAQVAQKDPRKGPESASETTKIDLEACRRILQTFRQGHTSSPKRQYA